MESERVKELNGEQLSYIGDSVYELYIRNYILNESSMSVNDLNTLATSYVKGESQARAAKDMLDFFTDDELSIYKRGKNSKFNSRPKSCSISDYKMASGLEAVLGYLFLMNQNNRIEEIMNKIIKLLEKNL